MRSLSILCALAGVLWAGTALAQDACLTDKPGEGPTEFEYAAQASVDAGRNAQLGLQAFGDLGTTHHLGGRQPHFRHRGLRAICPGFWGFRCANC